MKPFYRKLKAKIKMSKKEFRFITLIIRIKRASLRHISNSLLAFLLILLIFFSIPVPFSSAGSANSASSAREESQKATTSPKEESYLQKLIEIHNKQSTFEIKLWLNNQAKTKNFKIGSKIHFFFQASRDCYLTLMDISTDGTINILFPNKFQPTNFIQAGRVYDIPGDYQFDMTITGPEGIERVKAIATLQPVNLFDFDFSKNNFDSMPYGDSRAVRGVGGLINKLEKQNWAEAEVSFEIK